MAVDSSSATTLPPRNYDVFVSFCGPDDDHDGFLSYLRHALSREHIQFFIDDDLELEDEISETLLKTIEESKISLIVFSRNYASSRLRLDELVKIIECKNKYRQAVIPLFFKVSPSDGKQWGTYKEALARHEGHPNAQQWRNALTEATNISGWDSQVIRPVPRLIELLVQEILDILSFRHALFQSPRPAVSLPSPRPAVSRPSPRLAVFPTRPRPAVSRPSYLSALFPQSGRPGRPSRFAPHAIFSSELGLFGIDSRIEQLESLLKSLDSRAVRVLGLWGMGGIGKSTLATTLFNRLSPHFEERCFLANVREQSLKHGLENLQRELYTELLWEIDLELPRMMFKCLKKKVLIVLDDVSHSHQIELLAGRSWFGPGSIIILTSRDKEVIRKNADEIHEVQGLDHDDALCLFSQHAFKGDPRRSSDLRLANRVISFAKGNPLSLKILGSFLCGRSKEEQNSAFSKVEALKEERENQQRK